MNRLAEETSPYLRQHADNPVDWYPWGDEAFAAARRRDVPVLLSVGYSACHWCHVMAHQSFEDDEIAAQMNADFVSVKVDREERPDVDSIYMEAVQRVTGSGGWPMTVFLFPDGRPFVGGTYFPPPQFRQLLDQITGAWRDRRQELEAAADQLVAAVREGTTLPALTPVPGDDTEPDLLAAAANALLGRLDPEWGGLGRAPKFAQPVTLELLLQAWRRQLRPGWLEAVTTTLDAMAAGGIYDHLGGGFARYSTDRQWLVPHFEKMLYDNALLARVYLHAWQITGAAPYRQVVTETLEYLTRPPMRVPGAGFCSAEDADSEGEEGRFYVWSADEVEAVGGPAAVEWYGVTAAGNWEGKSILRRPLGAELIRPELVERARKALFERRETRVRPGLDDKVLTEWNAMAVAAFAEAGAVLDRPDWVAVAEEVARFLLASLRRPDGRWLRSWQRSPGEPSGAGRAELVASGAGRARYLAYAADYAWLVEAFTRLAEATGRARWMAEARQAADGLLALFSGDGGGFHTTGRDAETLIARPMETYDGALPSANAVAATALLRLGALTGEASYRQAAEAVIDRMRPALIQAPIAFTGLVAAADLARAGFTEVAVTGDRPELVAAAQRGYRPATVLAWGEPYDSPLWEGRTGPVTAGLAFVCHHYVCAAPISEPDQLRHALADAAG